MSDEPTELRMARLAGFELYYDDLESARRFYQTILGLELVDEQAGHYAKFGSGATFLCLERKGTESYPSRDKAVVFLEVPDLQATIEKVGRQRILRLEREQSSQRPAWAVLHDPEGYNVVLLQSSDRDDGLDKPR